MKTTAKIYNYQQLDPIDALDCLFWVREHYDEYNGECSLLWNDAVKQEFARIKTIDNELVDAVRRARKLIEGEKLLDDDINKNNDSKTTNSMI
jgi:hypothetical protein